MIRVLLVRLGFPRPRRRAGGLGLTRVLFPRARSDLRVVAAATLSFSMLVANFPAWVQLGKVTLERSTPTTTAEGDLNLSAEIDGDPGDDVGDCAMIASAAISGVPALIAERVSFDSLPRLSRASIRLVDARPPPPRLERDRRRPPAI